MFKKILVVVMLISLSACSYFNKKDIAAEDSLYQAYYNSIKDNSKYTANNNYFKISAEMSQLPQGNYLYYVFIDEPQIAMYDIKVMIMEDGFIMNEDSDLLATVGIVDDTKVNMIPYQVDSTLGYQKGIVLSGNASAEEVLLDVLVTWNNENMTKSFREFYQIKLNMNGFDLISKEIDGTN